LTPDPRNGSRERPPAQHVPAAIAPAGFPHEGVCDPVSAGMDPERLCAALLSFERQCARGAFPGGQIAVRRRGRLVLDSAVGTARGLRPAEREPRQAVDPRTRFAVFSATKPIVALAVAMLEERGVIDVAAPVARYFEEFGRNGKRGITVLDVLTHRAGVLTPDLLRRPGDWADRDKVRAALADAEPAWPRGTLAYMPYEYGWILAEVIQRAAGRPLGDFVAEEIAAPAVIPGLRFGAATDELPRLARAYWLGTRRTMVGEIDLSQTFEDTNNLPEVLTAFVPGAGVICDAADLAAFYDVLAQRGVTRRGERLISAEMLRRYTSLHVSGLDRSNRVRLRVARGFLLGSRGPSVYGWWGTQRCFGHAGAFCTQGWADPDLGLVVALVTNGNRGALDSLQRFAPLGSALRRACVR
jgi:CubicO group peptidase (beta-lactamase class C family)